MVPRALLLDPACAEAVDLAREAARRRCGVMGVGEHLEAVREDTRVVTHLFGVEHPGYVGWRWSVTVARASRAKAVTVNEVCLVPGEGALLPPRWVPWAERILPGDVRPGVLMPSPDNDLRLDPGFTGGEDARDGDPAEWSRIRAVVAELGLGRERVLSQYGRDEAAERWCESEGGPDNDMTRQAPGVCVACGYFTRLAGELGTVFGVCANEFSPTDGRVVSVDHGCGAHSDVAEPRRGVELPRPVWDTLSVDEMSLFD